MENELKIPEVGQYVRGVGTLVAVEEIPPPDPPPPTHDYIFEEITARSEVRLNGKRLTQLSGTNDFYGKLTSVNYELRYAQEWATERSIGPGSELEVVVVKITSRTRKKPVSEQNYYAKEFHNFREGSWGSKRDMPEDVEEVVWSSRTGPASEA